MNYSKAPQDRAAVKQAHRAAGVRHAIRRANKAFKAGRHVSRADTQADLWK